MAFNGYEHDLDRVPNREGAGHDACHSLGSAIFLICGGATVCDVHHDYATAAMGPRSANNSSADVYRALWCFAMSRSSNGCCIAADSGREGTGELVCCDMMATALRPL